MNCKIIKTAAAFIAAAVLLRASAEAEPVVSAKSAVLLDAASGRVLWEKNPDARSLIASTTKIMTGLLIAEDCCPDEAVVIAEDAVGIEGSSLCLQAGSRYSVNELLYGMLLHSGNDAAAALAIHHSGSIEAFAAAVAVGTKANEKTKVNAKSIDSIFFIFLAISHWLFAISFL